MERSTILLTTHGTVVCLRAGGTLYHLPFEALTSGDQPVMLDLLSVAPAFPPARDDQAEPRTITGVPGLPEGCTLILNPDGRTLCLRRGERFFTAEPMNQAMACDRLAASLWEMFVCLSEDDYIALYSLRNASWIQASTLALIQPDQITFEEGFRLLAGDLRIDLRSNLPLFPALDGARPDRALPLRITVLLEDHRIETLHRYDPLVVITAIGELGLDEAAVGLSSLLNAGRYDGPVHILTDLAATDPLSFVGIGAERLTIQRTAGRDARAYALLDDAGAWSRQPILVLGSNSVCLSPVGPLLARLGASHQLCTSAGEPHRNAPAHASPEVHSAQAEAGVIGIANLRQQSDLLHAARMLEADMVARRDDVPEQADVLSRAARATGRLDQTTLRGWVRRVGSTAAADRADGATIFVVTSPPGREGERLSLVTEIAHHIQHYRLLKGG